MPEAKEQNAQAPAQAKQTSDHPLLRYDVDGKPLPLEQLTTRLEYNGKPLKWDISPTHGPFYNAANPAKGKKDATISFAYSAEPYEKPWGLDIRKATVQVTVYAKAKHCPEEVVKLAMANSKVRDAHRAEAAVRRGDREAVAAAALEALRRGAASIPAMKAQLPQGVQPMNEAECKAYDAKHKAA